MTCSAPCTGCSLVGQWVVCVLGRGQCHLGRVPWGGSNSTQSEGVITPIGMNINQLTCSKKRAGSARAKNKTPGIP